MSIQDAHQVVHVVGARPNFIKAAPVLAALRKRGIEQRLVHTGQHYDELMSDVFFRDLGLPDPTVNLNVGSGTHGQQTAALLIGLEKAFVDLGPDAVIVYGDVNSTLAAALAAGKLLIPVVHVEAGLRSFDPTMPEELNRRVTDQIADLLLTTSSDACVHLGREGRAERDIRFVGNTMIDTLLAHRERFDPAAIRDRLGLPASWVLVTLHRPGNVDDDARARPIVEALLALAEDHDLVIPLHPRGRAKLEALGLRDVPRIRLIDPQGYVDFVSLIAGASLVVTDSGGVQEETTMLDVPCVTVRPNTERPVTISHGTNRLVEVERLGEVAHAVLRGELLSPTRRPPLWDGRAGERCADEIVNFLQDRAVWAR
jgi:UDP-N-acetylglucosamine 2-epimerase (non-hydrolysing)